ncbi:hypothetical protein B0I37DRAFT_402494, partial [Chaetomium sp. MPI-CAGE-AT-0009]
LRRPHPISQPVSPQRRRFTQTRLQNDYGTVCSAGPLCRGLHTQNGPYSDPLPRSPQRAPKHDLRHEKHSSPVARENAHERPDHSGGPHGVAERRAAEGPLRAVGQGGLSPRVKTRAPPTQPFRPRGPAWPPENAVGRARRPPRPPRPQPPQPPPRPPPPLPPTALGQHPLRVPRRISGRVAQQHWQPTP